MQRNPDYDDDGSPKTKTTSFPFHLTRIIVDKEMKKSLMNESEKTTLPNMITFTDGPTNRRIDNNASDVLNHSSKVGYGQRYPCPA